MASRRVLRLMREANLLAPTRSGRAHGAKAHDGVIVTSGRAMGQRRHLHGARRGQRDDLLADRHCTAECLEFHAAGAGRDSRLSNRSSRRSAARLPSDTQIPALRRHPDSRTLLQVNRPSSRLTPLRRRHRVVRAGSGAVLGCGALQVAEPVDVAVVEQLGRRRGRKLLPVG